MTFEPIHVSQEKLEEIVSRWDPDTDEHFKFRLPLCANCGSEIHGPMYHCWLADRVREIHLCNPCGLYLDGR